MSGLSCLFAAGECVDSVVGAWLAWFPYGLTGFTFVCGMLVGAALGKWGVAAVLALIVAVKVGGGDTHEHVSGKDAAPVVKPKKKVRTLKFPGLGK